MTRLSVRSKRNRPISRKFWYYLKYCPRFFREKIIRSKFDIEYQQPSDIIFKQAETADELLQAFKLVHDSYVHLGYMDPHPEQVRFTKFMALPTTVVLIAKIESEVIGTISIVMDSALGLPCDTTWNLSELRSNGRVVGEVSALTIKKEFKMRRGQFFLAICKMMYHFAYEILQLDTLVLATTTEVEPFYTDILLFKPIQKNMGQAHSLVKGNASSCCYAHLAELHNTYKKVYGPKPSNKNLWQYFVNYKLANIQLPEKKLSIPGYLIRKTVAVGELIRNNSNLISEFTALDRLVLNNLNPLDEYRIPNPMEARKVPKRLAINCGGIWLFSEKNAPPIEAKLVDISHKGFQVRVRTPNSNLSINEKIYLVMKIDEKLIHCSASVKWSKNTFRAGFEIDQNSQFEWSRFVSQVWNEIEKEIARDDELLAYVY